MINFDANTAIGQQVLRPPPVAADTGEQIQVDLVGVPRVTSASGQDLTPVGMRKRAILGLVALSPNRTVSRRWLEAMLWPDSDGAKASANLRQALVGLRRSLSDHQDILSTDRFDIGLDRSRVRVDILDTPCAAYSKMRAGRDLLEGIDVSSEDFEEWLRQERSTQSQMAEKAANGAGDRSLARDSAIALTTPPPGPQMPILIAESHLGRSNIELFVADSIVTQVGQTTTDLIRTEFRLSEAGQLPHVTSPAATCSVRVQDVGGNTAILVRLTDRMSGKLLWNRRITIDPKDEAEILDVAASLAVETAEIFTDTHKNASDHHIANAMAVSAMDEVFSFDPKRLDNAQRNLAQANALDPHAPRPALQALALAFRALEDPKCDRQDLQAQVQPLIEESRRLDAQNPVALAFLSDVYDHVFDDPATAMSLVVQSIRANPGFGYAYAGKSAFELLDGQVDAALISARKAHRQLRNSSLEVLSLMRLCVASMNANQLDAAMQAAQRAADLAPHSCPPLRHLYALKLGAGDSEGAKRALRQLRVLEPEFSMQRLRNDPEYPGSSIRRMGFHKLPDVEI